ncbi:hypothetical protein LIA77_04319 [Sarocladium implicatum]|nr:hypothetical protein LIA77_04319 [Sarocladium implicatum]
MSAVMPRNMPRRQSKQQTVTHHLRGEATSRATVMRCEAMSRPLFDADEIMFILSDIAIPDVLVTVSPQIATTGFSLRGGAARCCFSWDRTRATVWELFSKQALTSPELDSSKLF